MKNSKIIGLSCLIIFYNIIIYNTIQTCFLKNNNNFNKPYKNFSKTIINKNNLPTSIFILIFTTLW